MRSLTWVVGLAVGRLHDRADEDAGGLARPSRISAMTSGVPVRASSTAVRNAESSLTDGEAVGGDDLIWRAPPSRDALDDLTGEPVVRARREEGGPLATSAGVIAQGSDTPTPGRSRAWRARRATTGGHRPGRRWR